MKNTTRRLAAVIAILAAGTLCLASEKGTTAKQSGGQHSGCNCEAKGIVCGSDAGCCCAEKTDADSKSKAKDPESKRSESKQPAPAPNAATKPKS